MKKIFTIFSLLVAALAVNAQGEADYEIRTLTFEDADYAADEASFGGEKNWSSLIDDPQYNGALLYGSGMGYSSYEEAYKWSDDNNTLLSSALSEGYGSWCYWTGGHAISNYCSADIETYGGYQSQLTIYKANTDGDLSLFRTGGGHNGSDNFCVHFGYADNSGWGLTEESLPALTFCDSVARVIDHMYVTNTTYALNCYLNGNGLTPKITESDWVSIIFKGYNGDTNTGEVTFYLCNGPENIIMDWTKVDLTSLGKITSLRINITGSSDNGYGFSQPAYFAFDDVAVQFESNKATAVESVAAESLDNAPYYNLHGQRVINPSNGIFIHNGRPVRIK